MRIIAGALRGRKILWPKGDITRPITDRVKQSLFDVLTPLLPGARIYDCFCGGGSLGLESLSRGASQVTFFESDRAALAVLARNLADLQLQARSSVVSGDLFAWFERARALPAPVDIVFVDPPFRMLQDSAAALQALAEQLCQRHLGPEGTVVFRHEHGDSLPLAMLPAYDVREYGRVTIEFLSRGSKKPSPQPSP